MKDTAAIIESRLRAGYRAPQENPLACGKCGAIRKRYKRNKCYCLRHGFYVHSRGYCPAFSAEPFVPKPQTKPKFQQEELFK